MPRLIGALVVAALLWSAVVAPTADRSGPAVADVPSSTPVPAEPARAAWSPAPPDAPVPAEPARAAWSPAPPDAPVPAGTERVLYPRGGGDDRWGAGWRPWERYASTHPGPRALDDPARATGTDREPGEHGSPPVSDAERRDHLAGPVSEEGFRVAGGGSEAGEGDAVTFTVELHDEVGADLSEVVVTVEEALYDARSWVNDHTLQRIDDPDAAAIRVVLATPGTVDELCARAGLDTNGIYSCWNGHVAALNSMRWEEGATGFGDDLDTYRTYLINHEFGHGLGHGHVECTTSGGPAPVMVQQTRGTDACEPNGWPYPDAAEG